MNKHLLVSEFLTTPWALMPERLQAMTAVLTRWSSDEPPSEETLLQINADRVLRDTRKQFASDRAASNAGAGIAVLPLYGVVTQRGNMVDDISGPGSTSTQKFTSALRQVLADDSVGQILIDIDSPGGSVYGVAELATEIVKVRAQKPVVAVANSLAASAAYWIGCSAGEFYVTPGGEVGSIGVWQAHFDYSKALEEEGVKPTLISAGKFKVEGNPYVPLDPEAQAFMQSRVDDYYNAFIKAVAKGRGVSVADVRDGMGEGRVLGADAALAAKMVDGVATFDDVLARMQKAAVSQKPPGASRLGQARNALALLG
ncbi:signal peptide peptidase SppA [Limnohabitans radicicola]|uniref:Signal peptide peptidase SppA n=1 Tax=Limnohabitans radicicola TaxID=2771427 RepID=A0A927IN76_9BURK|nr:signal peptide peptidase SppA [Limnohabitans radicicola]MBD8051772.1 signal peptide peptidase SppA [Limnohabitans radicicola]